MQKKALEFQTESWDDIQKLLGNNPVCVYSVAGFDSKTGDAKLEYLGALNDKKGGNMTPSKTTKKVAAKKTAKKTAKKAVNARPANRARSR